MGGGLEQGRVEGVVGGKGEGEGEGEVVAVVVAVDGGEEGVVPRSPQGLDQIFYCFIVLLSYCFLVLLFSCFLVQN